MTEAAKHTPGPWEADIEDVSETFKHRAVIGPNGELVADCDGHRMSGEETAANTHLIATAPDLLDLAKTFRKTVLFYIGVDEKKGDDEGASLKRNTLMLIDEVLSRAAP
jgi:hypothetical protein